MKISLWTIGKTHEAYVKDGINEFTNRISRYFPVEWTIIPVPKNAASLPEPEQKKKKAKRFSSFSNPKTIWWRWMNMANKSIRKDSQNCSRSALQQVRETSYS